MYSYVCSRYNVYTWIFASCVSDITSVSSICCSRINDIYIYVNTRFRRAVMIWSLHRRNVRLIKPVCTGRAYLTVYIYIQTLWTRRYLFIRVSTVHYCVTAKGFQKKSLATVARIILYKYIGIYTNGDERYFESKEGKKRFCSENRLSPLAWFTWSSCTKKKKKDLSGRRENKWVLYIYICIYRERKRGKISASWS